MEYPLLPGILEQNRLAVTDVLKKVLFFDPEGKVISEIRINPNFVIVNPLENNNSVVFWKAGAEEATSRHFSEKLSIFGSGGQEIRELDVLKIAPQVSFLDPVFTWHMKQDSIFQINEQRGYEILVYGGDGSLVQKIQKQYDPVLLTAGMRETLLQGVPANSPLRDPAVIPSHFPPLHRLFSDENGRLYAVTFEKGENASEFWCDIFNQEGAFVARASLPVQFSRDTFPIYALVKNQQLYCVGEKENGFQQLKVFSMSWN